MRGRSKLLAGVLIPLIAGGCATSLSGCLESDVLVNYVLDQENGDVDYNNPDKLYVSDPESKTTYEDVQEELKDDEEKLEDVEEDLATSTDESNTDQQAESASYSETGTSSSTAAKQVKGKGDKGAGKGKGKSDKSDTNQQGKKNASVDSSNNVYDGSYGEVTDLPEDIETVCATGNAATIVLSIGGENALVGTSAQFKQDKENVKVFAQRGLSKAAVCWSADGASGDASVKDIIKAFPDAVLVNSGENSLTVAQERELGDAGIRVIVLPALTSNTNILTAVKSVGQLFANVTNRESVERAQSYTTMVDDALAIAKNAHGGGMATYQRRDYDDAENRLKKTKEDTMSDPNWSVFVTNWDSNAVVSGSFDGETVFKNAHGVASTWTGWSWSPVSYYMSCGGTINNAAAYGDLIRDPALRIFTQFSEKTLDYKWSVKPAGVKFMQGGGSISDTEASALLTNGYDAYESKSGNAHPLGSSDFNKVFVSSKQVKQGLESAQSSTLYKPVTWQSIGEVSGYGINLGGKLVMAYSVTKDSSRGDTGFDIIVNPCGMVGNWYAGSMESYLESLWISSEYYPDKISENDVKDAVEGFYRDYYGYSLSSTELENIMEGDYAE